MGSGACWASGRGSWPRCASSSPWASRLVWPAAPLAPLAAALAAGIWARAWVAPPTGWLLMTGAVLFIAGMAALVWRRERVATVALIGLTALLGMLRGATPPLPPDHIARVALRPSA